MFVLFLVLAILASWRFARIPGRYTAAMLAGVWIGVIAVLVLAPQSALARVIGGAPQQWALAGGLALAALGYGRLVALLKRHAVPAQNGAPDQLPPQTGNQTIPETATETAAEPPAAPPVIGPDGRPAAMTEAELDRYARHIVLREIGGAGQNRLRAAKVLVVGAGALGSPVALYLAAAGVGRMTLADDDHVGLSNLQRQVIFRSKDAGRTKVEAAAEAVSALNPHVAPAMLARRITADDAGLVAGFDLVLDGTDSFASRFAVNQACVAAGVPLVAGSIAQWEGQLTIWDPARDAPCLACVFPEPPAQGVAPSCAEAGVVGALPGVVGSMMALEAIKLLTGAGAPMRGRMLIFDGLWGENRVISMRRREGCAICGGIHPASPSAH